MKAKKTISLVLCAILLMVASVAGTLAYFTDQDAVVNTFTVGKVDIELAETEGTPNNLGGNAYHLLPGQTYVKDPTVTVVKGSEECYVRMMVKVSDMAKLKAAMPSGDLDFTAFYSGELFLLQMLTADETGTLTWNPAWECVDYVDGTYEFRYNTTVNASEATENIQLPALFTKITVPGAVTETQMPNLQGMQITVTAHAIQAAGFANADAAWLAFNDQNNP